MKLTSVVVALLASLLFAPVASAAVKAEASLVRAGEAVRLQVRITSTKRFTAATQPRGVKVGAVKLKRVASAAKSSTWRSTAGAKVDQLAGKRAAVRVTTRGGTKTLRPLVAAAPAADTMPEAITQAPTITEAPAAATLTRNDAAGQSAMTSDILLEWSSYGSVTAEFRRIWLLADGRFRLNVVDWMQEMGEKCRPPITGTWAFKEGYTTDAQGGLTLVKITLTTSNGSGDEVLTFATADPNGVYIGGSKPVRYERNPQIMQNCG